MGLVHLHEVDGAFVFVTDDVACLVMESEFGILVVVCGKFGDATFDGGRDGIFGELVAFDDTAGFEVEELVAAPGVAGGDEADAGCASGHICDTGWVGVVVDLCVCAKREASVFRVVELGAYDDVAGAICLGDATCSGECVDPHDGECHDFDEHARGEDAEW